MLKKLLKNSKVLWCGEIEDYKVLETEQGTVCFFNPLLAVGAQGEKIEWAECNLNDAQIASVEEKRDSLTIYFSCGVQLKLDLRPESYTTPEAFSFVSKDGKTMIVN